MLDLYSYTKTTDYLNAFYEMQKGVFEKYSKEQFATYLGLSTSHLKMILNGSRKLTIETIHKIANRLNLGHKERRYFEAMALCEQASSGEEKAYYQQRLDEEVINSQVSLKKYAGRDLFNEWFYPALLLYLVDVNKSDIEQLETTKIDDLCRRLMITSTDFERFLSFINTDELNINHDQKLHILFDRLKGTVTKSTYIRDNILKSLERLEGSFSSKDHIFATDTISIASSEISNFRNDYYELIDIYIGKELSDSEETKILQCCLQAFPVF